MTWKPNINENGICINNPCGTCSGKLKGVNGQEYTCDNCPIL